MKQKHIFCFDVGSKWNDNSNPNFCISHGIKMYIKTQHNNLTSIVNQFLMHQILIRSVIYFGGLYFAVSFLAD